MFDPLKNYNFDRMNNLVREIGSEQERKQANTTNSTTSSIEFNEENTVEVNLKFDEFMDNIELVKPFLYNIERFIISYNELSEEQASEKVDMSPLSKKCKILDASHNNFKNMSHAFWSFLFNASITYFNLSNNCLVEFISSKMDATWLPKLEYLILANNSICSLINSTETSLLSSLIRLDLSNNLVDNDSLNNILFGGNLTNLKHLYVKNNKVSGTLKNVNSVNQSLEEIYLDENQIEQVDNSWFSSLPNLKVISLPFNKIQDIDIQTNNKIEKIYLHSNQIKSIDSIKAVFSDSLKVFSAHQNQISTIPEEISNSISLREVTFFNNTIQQLPKGLYNLINIDTLYLQNNEIAELLPELGNLTNLTELDLFNNKLSSLPSTIGNLTKLKRLCLDSNRLKTIPADVVNLSNLISFTFHNNPELKVSPYIQMMSTGM
ncbi:predicted protein [Naegleria gruberi]|uniref:Predicted protein n=1 Tax=Naegleria gruberi TaxID=5762 RepID=D2V1S7_NAEGR|nr:uncharacterized protein NAEGRDRAFT_45953 [Naegleria gruberi]EFC49213.1 predicted protein [Naegleria gruberi]|eukprot:XP_002681957.1 predicted protein [Naegleria gruberi strain NEG-M]